MDWLRDRLHAYSPCLGKQTSPGLHRQPTRRELLPRPPPSSGAHISVDETDLGRPDEVLQVDGVDPLITRNGSAHHTKAYELMRREKSPQLVLRRGQPFFLKIKTSKQYSEKEDAISFVFTLKDASKPGYGQGSLIVTPLLAKDEISKNSWKANLESCHENILMVQITPDAECVVGKWIMEIDTKLLSTGKANSFRYPDFITIIFNPWCKDDPVYIDGEEKRKEYVLTDTGLIFRGSKKLLQPSVWKYAQFEEDILDCSLYLMNTVGKVPLVSSGNPIVVTRALSAAINVQDDNGVVVGNWTTEYDGGKKPTEWVGSMGILQKYYKTKKPVKYGQCWVFAGVLTTVCRALGIPARVVTTYASAHDTQCSLTVDYFINDEGDIMDELQSDSIWNFHVWTEVWMKRGDLGHDCDGWQAIDATPQELSEELYRCGPASVAAVKRGDVLRPHDVTFVYAEVNADMVYWKYSGPTQPLKLIKKDVHGVGLTISTKAVGKWAREDITHNYKFPEKTEDERTAMLKALKQSESLFSRYYLNEEFNEIYFDLKLLDDIVIGSPFQVILEMKNRSKTKEYSVTTILRVDSVIYTGKVKESVKRDKFDSVLKPGDVEEVKMAVTYDEYSSKLMDQCAFNLACLATVHDTNYEYFAQDDFRVRKPDIKIKLDGDAIKGVPVHVAITLKNPLPRDIKKGEFRIEGPGIEKNLRIKVDGPIAPNEEARASFNLTPTYGGKGVIIAKFISKELDDCDGFLNFMIQEKNSETNGISNNI